MYPERNCYNFRRDQSANGIQTKAPGLNEPKILRSKLLIEVGLQIFGNMWKYPKVYGNTRICGDMNVLFRGSRYF